MKKRITLLLLLCCLLLSGCTRDPLAPIAAPSANNILAPVVTGLPEQSDLATLWFRYGAEPLLAPETRVITHSRAEGHALAIMRALIDGPGASSNDLAGLFPQGTQVISCTQSGNIMFVMLSKHIMNGYADEPAAWRDDPYWAAEVPLRRELAMQSIAATLTENCPVDTVVILVEQSGSDSLRLRQSYYMEDSDALADPLIRNESLLLTPARTVEVIRQCWQEGDFARLYQYVATLDPTTSIARPEESEFLALMADMPRLLHARAEGGSVSLDGKTAVFTVSGVWLEEGNETPFTGMVLRLTREQGIWRIGLNQLRREALP
ncbi:MAG: GerMN domain-containing protein [Clostridia bacterium]|nr:GerMN domain-containing protein [Clostridia bacterium]